MPPRLSSAAPSSALLATLLVGVLTARAAAPHSAWPTHASHKVVVHVEGDRLTVDFTVEIPVYELILLFNDFYSDIDLVAEIEKGRVEELEEEFRSAQLEHLVDDVEIDLDGEPLTRPLRPVDTPINGRATEGFFVYLWELGEPVALPRDRPTEIVVRNRVLDGKQAVFANLIDLRGPFELREVSTPQPPRGADLSLGSPAEMETWSSDEARRELRVVLAPASP